jgi:hypothetical protein
MRNIKIMIRILLAILLLIPLRSCNKEIITLNQLANNTVIFETQEISLDSLSFSVMIPKDWYWQNETEECDGENILIMINAVSSVETNGYIDIISIQKLKSQSNSNDILTEYNHLLELSKKQTQGLKMIESGKTDILNYPAYYLHTKSITGTYGEAETIGFIIKSEDEGYFYHLIAGASQTEDLKTNLSIMIQSLQTFKILN